jgi:malate synthase
MWAMPDRMADMLAQKIGHPKSGANTAWVPSPTGRDAARHALSSGRCVRRRCRSERKARRRAKLDDCCLMPLRSGRTGRRGDPRELDNNAQGILGYVVRWVDQGVGCSKVPDINDVGLMEDRATCASPRSTWPTGCITASLHRGAGDGDHEAHGRRGGPPERGRCHSIARWRRVMTAIAFQAACDLVFKGRAQPNGLYRAGVACEAVGTEGASK